MTRLGYQIPNFTYPGVETRRPLRRRSPRRPRPPTRSGFDTVLLMDHFYQLPMLGDARRQHARVLHDARRAGARDVDRPARRARHRQHVPQPDAAREDHHRARRRERRARPARHRRRAGSSSSTTRSASSSSTFTDRFEKLEEALQIILPMLRDETPTFDGKHYTVRDAINHPAPISRIPVMIGGSGEKKTLRMVAQYADESNLTSPPDRAPAQARGDRRALRAARPRPEHAHGEPAPERRCSHRRTSRPSTSSPTRSRCATSTCATPTTTSAR